VGNAVVGNAVVGNAVVGSAVLPPLPVQQQGSLLARACMAAVSQPW